MRIERTVMAAMPAPYAVTLTRIGRRPAVLAGSEARDGHTILFEGPERRVSTMTMGPGGVMDIVPWPGADRPVFVAIEAFFPIFQSTGAGLAALQPGADIREPWARRRVLDLPYVHRLTRVARDGRQWAVAATLCAGKAHQEDWSQPGAVYAIPADRPDGEWPAPGEPILDGLTHNHGMFTHDSPAGSSVFVSADEGVFRVTPDAGGAWTVERVLDVPTGGRVRRRPRRRRTGRDRHHRTVPMGTRPGSTNVSGAPGNRSGPTAIAFGHTLWAGTLMNRPVVLLGSRADRKDLVMHVFFRPTGLAERGCHRGMKAGARPISPWTPGRAGNAFGPATTAPTKIVCYDLAD